MKSGNILDDFVWTRARAGYTWRQEHDGALVVPVSNDDAVEHYRLGDRAFSGLFLAFARLKPTPTNIAAFANEFGPLGFPVTVVHFGPSKVSKEYGRFSTIDAEQLSKPPNRAERDLGQRGEFVSLRSQLHRRATWSFHIKLMRDLLDARKARRGGSWERKWELELVLRTSVWPMLDDDLVGRMQPVSLLGALWLQAILAGGRDYRECATCSQPIEISRLGGARTDARFCSNACKTKDFRDRRAEARRLAASGMRTNEIAKRVRSDVATVRRWLK